MWSDSRPELSFFPTAPPGSNMFSRYVAYHYLSGNRSVSTSKIALFGDHNARAIDPFGASLVKVAQVVPSQNFSIGNLLERSTLFGFYSAALPPERRDAWRENQLAARARLVNKFITGQSGFFLTKPYLHFCPDCVEEDEDSYGLGHWRLIHQIPGVASCGIHGTALAGACVQCQASIASENHWHPPARRCPHCGGHRFQTMQPSSSPAYEEFRKLCESVIDGASTNLTYGNRPAFYFRFYNPNDVPHIAAKKLRQIVELVLAQWRLTNLGELSQVLSTKFDQKFVCAAVSGQDHIVNPVGHLAIISALVLAAPFDTKKRRTVTDTPMNSLSSRCTGILTSNNIIPECVIFKLNKLAHEHGLPANTGLMLLEGKSQTATFRELGICGARVGRFAKVLNELRFGDLMQNMEQEVERRDNGLTFREIIRLVKEDELRETNRTAILKILESDAVTKSRLRELAPHIFSWCRINDKQWLSQICPQETLDEIRARHRSAILDLMKTGCRSQRSVKKENFTAYHWCRQYDRDWLDQTLPSVHKYKNLSVDEMRILCRSIITNALSSGVLDRRSLHSRAMSWCRKNDTAWLDATIPRKDFRPNATGPIHSEIKN